MHLPSFSFSVLTICISNRGCWCHWSATSWEPVATPSPWAGCVSFRTVTLSVSWRERVHGNRGCSHLQTWLRIMSLIHKWLNWWSLNAFKLSSWPLRQKQSKVTLDTRWLGKCLITASHELDALLLGLVARLAYPSSESFWCRCRQTLWELALTCFLVSVRPKNNSCSCQWC